MGTEADIIIFVAGYGSVWLERTAGGREVAGSNPVTPIFLCLKKTLENAAFILYAAFSGVFTLKQKSQTFAGLIISILNLKNK